MRRFALLLVALLAIAAVLLQQRDPESRTLDAAARAGVPGRFVALRDGMTHVEVGGPDSGAKVMLVHGFSVPAYIWDSTFTALTAAGFRVARYDTYGRGYSDRPDVTYDLDLFDRQLAGVLDSLGWRDSVHLMGLSFGGAITAAFVGRHPERVRSYVLVDPVAGDRSSVPSYFALPVVGPMLWQALAVPGMADGQASDFVTPSKWPDWADRYRPQMQFTGFGRSLLRTLQAGQSVQLDTLYASAGKQGKPTLLFWGVEDQTVKIASAAQVRQAMPQTEFHAIAGAGHLPHIEKADVVNPVLIGWLRAH
jgi:pimeloyl-ACP methyl ester carboxylesterase